MSYYFLTNFDRYDNNFSYIANTNCIMYFIITVITVILTVITAAQSRYAMAHPSQWVAWPGIYGQIAVIRRQLFNL